MCVFLSIRRAFGGISRVKEPHSSSPYNCADSEPGQTSLIFLVTTKRSARRVERSQPGWAEGEKESPERKLPFYTFQLVVPPQKSGPMGLGRKTVSAESRLCICPLPWCHPSRMGGTRRGRPRRSHPEPRAWGWRREGGRANKGGGPGGRWWARRQSRLIPRLTGCRQRCLPRCQHLPLPGHRQRPPSQPRAGSPGIQLSLEIQTSASISALNIFGLPGPGEYEGRVKKQLFSFLEKSGMRTPLLRLA